MRDRVSNSIRRAALFAGGVAVAAAMSVAASAADKVSVRTDWFFSAYHSPFFVGIEKGFYRDAGLEVTPTEGRGSGQVVQLVGTNEDEFGFASTDAVFRAVERGLPVIAIANVMPEMGQAIYVLKKSGITDPKQLKGRSIAITPGGTNEALLPAMLKNAGLSIDDLKQVSVSPANKVRMFMEGQFDAMMATAWARALFDPVGGADMFVYSDYGVSMVGYNIVANPEWAAKNPDVAKRFVAATMKAWEYAKAHPDEALEALATHSANNAKEANRQRNAKDFPDALRFVGPAVEGKPMGYHNAKAWQDTQEMLAEVGVVKEKIPLDRVFTNAYVAADSM